jgi:hypothetical protein
MRVYFAKALLPDAMTDEEFLDEFSIHIASTTSGQPDNPVLQPRARYRLIRNPDWQDYSVEFTFSNLYNGDPDFLHHVAVEHRRGAIVHGASRLVRMAPSNIDTSGDGMPDWWKRMHGLDPYNPAGIHGRSGDFDEDGLTNWQEYVADLTPNFPGDGHLFPKLAIIRQPDGSIRLEYPVLQGRRYRVWHSPDLLDWQPLADWWWPWPDDTRHGVTDSAPANPGTRPPRRHYRLEIDMN